MNYCYCESTAQCMGVLRNVYAGSEIFRWSADFRGILVNPEISVNLERNLKGSMEGGYLGNYPSYKDGSPIKIFRILLGNPLRCYHNCTSMKNKPNVWYFGCLIYKIQAKSHAARIFSLYLNHVFHCLSMCIAQCPRSRLTPHKINFDNV